MQVRRGIRGVSLASLTVAKTPCFVCFFVSVFYLFFSWLKKEEKKENLDFSFLSQAVFSQLQKADDEKCRNV